MSGMKKNKTCYNMADFQLLHEDKLEVMQNAWLEPELNHLRFSEASQQEISSKVTTHRQEDESLFCLMNSTSHAFLTTFMIKVHVRLWAVVLPIRMPF